MYRFKQGALCTVTLVMLALTGCSTTEKKPTDLELQRSAMQRWNACLERNASPPTVSVTRIKKVLSFNCEGHKRDVIASFPKHMATQIDQMLTTHAYELLDNNEGSMELSSQEGELLQTLLR